MPSPSLSSISPRAFALAVSARSMSVAPSSLFGKINSFPLETTPLLAAASLSSVSCGAFSTAHPESPVFSMFHRRMVTPSMSTESLSKRSSPDGIFSSAGVSVKSVLPVSGSVNFCITALAVIGACSTSPPAPPMALPISDPAAIAFMRSRLAISLSMPPGP